MFSVDPLFTNYPWQSPYAYSNNSPIWIIDIKGMGGPTNTYTVKSGDTPESIAKSNSISIWDLARNNQGSQEGGGYFNDIGKGS